MDRKLWLEWRRGGIGSSDAPVVMGVSPWSTPYLLWKEKVYGTVEKEANAAMKRGTELEAMVREMLENDTCTLLEPRNITHPVYPWMRSSLDAISLDGKMLYEIKCPGKEDHQLARQQLVPSKYYPQLMHQLACTGLPYLFYVSYYEGSYVQIKVMRNEQFITELIRNETAFWACVESKNPPEKTSKDYQEKDSDEEWKELVEEWKPVYSALKSMEEKEKTLRDRIIAISEGKNSVGNGVKLTRMECQGHIDYDRALKEYVEELNKRFPSVKFDPINVDAYRKASIQKFRLSLF